MLGISLAAGLAGGGWLLLRDEDTAAHAQGKPSPTAPQAPDDIRQNVEKRPASVDGQLTFGVEVPKVPVGAVLPAPGAWVSEKIYAKGQDSAVVGYATDTSEPAWTLELPGQLCAAAKHITVDGRTAVVSEDGKRAGPNRPRACSILTVFDVDTGRQVFRKTMPDAQVATQLTADVAITRGVVASAWGDGSVAYDLDTGKQVWKSRATSQCRDTGFGGGRELLAVVECGDENREFRVQRIDARTGEPQWTYKVDSGIQRVSVLSSDPPVIGITAGDVLETDVITLDDQGRHQARIALKDNHYQPNCNNDTTDGVESCRTAVVSEDRLYLPTEERYEAGEPANEIVAFSLTTGKAVQKFDGRPGLMIWPLRMSGDRLIAYRQGGGWTNGAVLSLDPATGKQSIWLVVPVPEGINGLMRPKETQVIFERGRLYFAATGILGPDKEGEEYALEDNPLTVGFQGM
ncbi:PQQ-binding-like beta-propeller repeat protein [Streptomyces albus]|uniref:outer membrane protein assembly factor BamB family protein n=1 Tax=Streptomyces albus TaxID=1888 RepID=UPI00131C49DA|nr:PQQ-binding-like beta-propeller repeat protein [Streptomyces albus]